MSTFKKVQKMVSGLMTLFFFTSTMIVACGDSLNPPSEQEVDPEIIANTQLAERMELWINTMDPFVTQNEDWTFSLDWEAFLNAIAETDPDIIAYFHGGGEGNDDTTTIETLRDGISIANVEMLRQFEAYQSLPDNVQPAITTSYSWWGIKACYTGSDLTWIRRAVCGSALVLWGVPIAQAYLGYLCYVATMECSSKFCISFTWVGVAWGSCS